MITPYSPRKSVFYVVLFEILGKPLGLITSVLIAYYFGAGKDLDAFLWSSFFLMFCAGTVVGTWPMVITPVLTKIDATDKEQAWGYISAVLSYGALLVLGIGGYIYFFADVIVRSFTDFGPETQKAAIGILKNLVPFFVFNGIYQIEKTILNSYRNFKVTAVAELLSKILLFGSLFLLTNHFYINSLVIGNVLLAFFQFAVPLYVLLKVKNVFTLRLNCDFSWIKISAIMVMPFYISQIINSFTELFYRYVASGLEEGSLSYLSYGIKVKDLAVGTLAFSVSAIAFTEFSRSYSVNDHDAFSETFYKSVFTVWFVIIPVSAFFFFFGDGVITLLFKRGSFDDESTINTYRVLRALSVGLFAWGGNYFTHKAFFSFHDTVTPLLVSIPNTFIVIALYYFLARWCSVYGIALALAIEAMWAFWLYLFVFRCKHMRLDLKLFFRKLLTFAVLSVMCFGIFRYSLNEYFDISQDSVWMLFVKVSVAFVVPMCVYAVVSYLMKIPEAVYVFNNAVMAKDKVMSKVGRKS